MRSLPAPLAVYTRRRTWGELAYALLGLPQGVAFFVIAVVTLAVGAGLAITFVGIPVLVATNLFCRLLARESARGGSILLGEARWAAAPAPRSKGGVLGWLGARVADQWAWRARLYLVLKLPLGVVSFVAAVAFWVYGLGALTYAIWRPFLPCQSSDGGTCHRGVGIANGYYIDTPLRIVWFAAAGALLVLAAPWVVKGIVALDRWVARGLLVPSWDAERVAELERSRSIAVDDAATTLRRIERDLHDGAQARLVSLAMNVGLAKEKLAEGGDPDEARRLLDIAHAGAKDAIVELRDLARGIHPPVLDAGLDKALATLAANSAVPVRLSTAIASRPSEAVETIAYFCTAELLTNVAKHSGATLADVDVRTDDSLLRLIVRDDGHGGARVGAGTGLAGLADRVRTVDGTLEVTSPTGGPTAVTVCLPLRGRRA